MSEKMRKFVVKPGHVYRDDKREYAAGEEVLIADDVVMTKGYPAGQLREVVGAVKAGKKPESFAPPAEDKAEEKAEESKEEKPAKKAKKKATKKKAPVKEEKKDAESEEPKEGEEV